MGAAAGRWRMLLDANAWCGQARALINAIEDRLSPRRFHSANAQSMVAVDSFRSNSVKVDQKLVIRMQPVGQSRASLEQIRGDRLDRFGDFGALADALADSACVEIQHIQDARQVAIYFLLLVHPFLVPGRFAFHAFFPVGEEAVAGPAEQHTKERHCHESGYQCAYHRFIP